MHLHPLSCSNLYVYMYINIYIRLYTKLALNKVFRTLLISCL